MGCHCSFVWVVFSTKRWHALCAVWCNQSGGSAIGSLGAGTFISNITYDHIYTNGMALNITHCWESAFSSMRRRKPCLHDQVKWRIWNSRASEPLFDHKTAKTAKKNPFLVGRRLTEFYFHGKRTRSILQPILVVYDRATGRWCSAIQHTGC